MREMIQRKKQLRVKAELEGIQIKAVFPETEHIQSNKVPKPKFSLEFRNRTRPKTKLRM